MPSMIFAALLTAALQNPAPLPRTYQPLLLDPHIRAGGFTQPTPQHPNGLQNGFLNGDMTPDGRLMLAYRRVDLDAMPATGPIVSRQALTAAMVRPERFQLSNGHIQSFVDANGDYVFGNSATIDGDPTNDEFKIIHHGYEFFQVAPGTPGAIDVSGSPFPALSSLGQVQLDPDYPIGLRYAGSHITMALVPDPHAGGSPDAHGNPYPSDAVGRYRVAGQYTTYKLWVVRLTSEGWVDHIEANPTGGDYFRPELDATGAPAYPAGSELVSQIVTVIIDETTSEIHATNVEPFQRLATIADEPIRGIEVSITADGKLILFQGRADDPLAFSPGHADVTYVYNQQACSPTGWTPVRSITVLPQASEIEMTIDEFKQRYRVFQNPIRIGTSDGGSEEHLSGDHVRGAYTWISKDGSFFHATCGPAIDNAVAGEQTQGPGCRVGNYICGDITGGYIKYIDETGINPTRNGQVWDWPSYRGAKDSQRNLVMSLGLKPGLWEGFIGSGAPMPTTRASQRVPILPLIVNSDDIYGEVRFEEADGNYLLYLACNEALVHDVNSSAPIGTDCHIFSTDYTPDTSGQAERATVTLNDGAGFPQEAYGSSVAVQNATAGVFLGSSSLRFHENVGFKGQGILVNLSGRVEAAQTDANDSSLDRFLGLQAFSAQLFVKTLMAQPAGTAAYPLIRHGVSGLPPAFTLSAHEDGSFSANLWLYAAGQAVQIPLQTGPGYVQWGSDVDDCRDGWSHVVVTFDGERSSSLKIWVDGVECATFTNALPSKVLHPSDVGLPDGAAYYAVGPGSGGSGTAVSKADAVFVVDEVAISDVARTEEEIRRDAYVADVASPFTTLPAGVTLPSGLDAGETFWPIGVPHSAAIVDLGRDLFSSNDLSAPGVQRSCSSCHDPLLGFAENQPLASSTLGGFLDFNSPTLIGTLFAGHKTFSGKARTIEEQIPIPLTSPAEMGAQTLADIAARLSADLTWKAEFNTVFSSDPTEANLIDALSAYTLTLNSGNSAFDQDKLAPGVLTNPQRAGLALFVGKARCIACHRGSAFTDGDFHNIQSVVTALSDRGDFTGRVREDGAVKTPSLRNLASTGPYFHNGSKVTLGDVVSHYNAGFMTIPSPVGGPDRFLRPLGLTATEISDLVAFLGSLNGSAPN